MPEITIDLTYFEKFLFAASPTDVMVQFFFSGGWVIFLYIFLWGLWHVWVESRQGKFIGAQKTVLLAIDVPKETEQSPKAVEHVFATLNGTLQFLDNYEKFWLGKVQTTFSFELVSIDGYVQFFIRVWSRYRDVVESAIYAQYPDAEITEVEDYTAAAPKVFPAEGWDLFGTEFVLANKSQYSIRTHPAFEHSPSAELKDPMSGMLEGLSKLKPGEQLWIQILISPSDGKDWLKEGDEIVKKLTGVKEKPKKTIFDEIIAWPMDIINYITGPSEVVEKKDNAPPSLMQHLSPGEKTVVEGLQMKMSKIVFKTKIRVVYVGKKETFSKARTISNLKGTFGQFTILDQNGFRLSGDITTRSDYWWQRNKMVEYLTLFMMTTLETRQNAILRAYRKRGMAVGATPFMLNIEELATIYHFPVITVKAPLLKKTEAKRAEPPFMLPVMITPAFTSAPSRVPQDAATRKAPPSQTSRATTAVEKKTAIPIAEESIGSPPDNLPFV